MLLVLEDVLSADILATLQQALHKPDDTSASLPQQARWQTGQLTAGAAAGQVKANEQFNRQHPSYPTLADSCLQALYQQPQFMAAALPHTVLPPLFSRYQSGHRYGYHVDNALQQPGTGSMQQPNWVRTDIALTLFLSDPASYSGGELEISDHYGTHQVKLAAGSAVLYPATSLHRVAEVTAGMRLAMVTWVQSLVRDDGQREILYELDMSQTLLRQKLQQAANDEPQRFDGLVNSLQTELQSLTQVYHNLLRQWASC